MKNLLSMVLSVLLIGIVVYLITPSNLITPPNLITPFNKSDTWSEWQLRSYAQDFYSLISIYQDNDNDTFLGVVVTHGLFPDTQFMVYSERNGQILLENDIEFVSDSSQYMNDSSQIGNSYKSNKVYRNSMTTFAPTDNEEILDKLFLPENFNHRIKITLRFDQSEYTVERPLYDMVGALDKLVSAQLKL